MSYLFNEEYPWHHHLKMGGNFDEIITEIPIKLKIYIFFKSSILRGEIKRRFCSHLWRTQLHHLNYLLLFCWDSNWISFHYLYKKNFKNIFFFPQKYFFFFNTFCIFISTSWKIIKYLNIKWLIFVFLFVLFIWKILKKWKKLLLAEKKSWITMYNIYIKIKFLIWS